MSWFLVLLFWNPAVLEYQVADGWSPLPFATVERCELRLEYVEQYLPDSADNVIDCIQAKDEQTAISILKR